MSIASRSFKIIWRVIKLLGTLLVAFVCIFLLWRMFSRGASDDMELISVDSQLYEAYEENGKNVEFFRQDKLSITSDGFFADPDCIFIPETNQIQIIIRYNNSTLRALAENEKYALDSVPDRNSNVFDVTLLVQTDLTPDDDTDNTGKNPETVKYTRCHGTLVKSEQKNLYNFRRYVFDLDDCGIDMKEMMKSGDLLAIYCDFYYVNDINYEERPYSTLFIYDYKRDNKWDEISKEEAKLFEEFGKNQDK